MNVRIVGLREARQKLRLLRTEVSSKSRVRLAALAGAFVEKAKQLAPVETGRLRNSIVMQGEGSFKIVAEAKAPYAGFVEYGTRPHEIRPRRRRFLRFTVDGKVVYATRVHHPGTSPKPYWRPALEHAAEKLPEIFQVWEVIE